MEDLVGREGVLSWGYKMAGVEKFDVPEALALCVRIQEAIAAVNASQIEEIGLLDPKIYAEFVRTSDEIDAMLGLDKDWQPIAADWRKLLLSWNEEIYDDIELAQSVQERALLFWQQLSRFVTLVSKLAETADSVVSETPVISEAPIVEGPLVRKTVKVASGGRAIKVKTSYDTGAFKILGDLSKCLSEHERGFLRKLCYLTYTYAILKGVLDTMSQFVRLVSVTIPSKR